MPHLEYLSIINDTCTLSSVHVVTTRFNKTNYLLKQLSFYLFVMSIHIIPEI